MTKRFLQRALLWAVLAAFFIAIFSVLMVRDAMANGAFARWSHTCIPEVMATFEKSDKITPAYVDQRLARAIQEYRGERAENSVSIAFALHGDAAIIGLRTLFSLEERREMLRNMNSRSRYCK